MRYIFAEGHHPPKKFGVATRPPQTRLGRFKFQISDAPTVIQGYTDMTGWQNQLGFIISITKHFKAFPFKKAFSLLTDIK